MRVQARVRRAMVRVGAVGTVLLVVAWMASGWGTAAMRMNMSNGYVSLEVGVGKVRVSRSYGAPFKPPRVQWYRHSGFAVQWEAVATRRTFGFGINRNDYTLALWCVVVPLAGATVLLWRRDARLWAREQEGKCVGCGYDLNGLGGAGGLSGVWEARGGSHRGAEAQRKLKA